MISQVNRRAALFLLLYVAVILYLSLYPWRFVPNYGPRTLMWVPLATRRTLLDAALNVAFYVPLGAAAFASLRRSAWALVAAVAFGTLVSFGVERAQLSIPSRFGNLSDLLSNSFGALLGTMAAAAAGTPRLASRLRVLYSPGLLLLGLWAIWQAFTFLLPRNLTTIDASHEIAGLLVLAWVAARRPIRAAVPLFLVWLAADELRPFQFQAPPQPFWWLPFESWFGGAPESFYGILSGKLFLYTAILWMERRAGIGWLGALAVPGAILAAGEFAQRYLPGRTPEITDLVLLLAGAVLLNLVEPTGIIKDRPWFPTQT